MSVCDVYSGAKTSLNLLLTDEQVAEVHKGLYTRLKADSLVRRLIAQHRDNKSIAIARKEGGENFTSVHSASGLMQVINEEKPKIGIPKPSSEYADKPYLEIIVRRV